jgi:hypothetical protein
MTQPNFLQVERALTGSLAFVAANPNRISSVQYGSALSEMHARWLAATEETDLMYSDWRTVRGDRMRQFRRIRVVYDQVLELADEHAYDDAPTRKIVYTEEEDLLALVDDTLAWLDSKGTEWDWVTERAMQLRTLRAEAVELRKTSEAKFQKYSIIVKYRVAAYGDAVSLLREYLRELHADPGSAEGAPELDVL